jgi:hypothetical protein
MKKWSWKLWRAVPALHLTFRSTTAGVAVLQKTANGKQKTFWNSSSWACGQPTKHEKWWAFYQVRGAHPTENTLNFEP